MHTNITFVRYFLTCLLLFNISHLLANGPKSEDEAELDPVLFSMSTDKSVMKMGEEFSIDIQCTMRDFSDIRLFPEALNGEFVELARNDAAARRLTSIPGIGVLNATVLVAAVGNASSFAKARDLGSWLGLVPRQYSTGGKARLLGISKRGNTYLHTLIIHGARAALPSLLKSDTPMGHWLKAMIERGVHRNAVVVALANKLARIAWAALRKETHFERGYLVATA